MRQIKPMDFWSGKGANRSDTGWYREDLQRGRAEKTRFDVAESDEHYTSSAFTRRT